MRDELGHVRSKDELFIMIMGGETRQTIEKILNRLAEYEETETMPDEVTNMKKYTTWVSIDEALPSTNRIVLIKVKNKTDGELCVCMSSYCCETWGGKRFQTKHWSKPWQDFEFNYEILAWTEILEP